MSTKYRVVNPASGQVESEFPTATDTEVERAVSAAHSAFQRWRAAPLAERAAVLRGVADLYERRKDTLAPIVTREMGKTLAEAVGEVEYCALVYRYFADNAEQLLADEPLSTGDAVIRKSPTGVILGIMPWNYPHYQVARFVGPNLVAGNTVLLKHAPQCPESALAMEELFAEAGLLHGAYVNIFATNDQVAGLIADERVRGVSVTGSERAGAAVATLAGQYLKKVVLELGGSDPYLVLDAEELDPIVRACAEARFGNAGQACNAAKRLIVAEPIYDEFVADLVERVTSDYRTGDPLDPAVTLGPMSSEGALQTLDAQVQDAVSKGATVHTGGHRLPGRGAYYPPTVLSGVTPDMRAYREELFGPVAVVYRASSIDDAVELANDSPFGLGAAVFHRDETSAVEIADRIDAGMVFINSAELGRPELPFGGTKRSGVGRELGPHGIDEFLNLKMVRKPGA